MTETVGDVLKLIGVLAIYGAVGSLVTWLFFDPLVSTNLHADDDKNDEEETT